jgi:hypothetical protein
MWVGRAGQIARMAAIRGYSVCPFVGGAIPGVAVALPRGMALGLSAYLDECAFRGEDRDTVAMYRFFRDSGMKPLVAVPNLVEHDRLPIDSLWTRTPTISMSIDVKAGLRRSACFLDKAPESRREHGTFPLPHALPLQAYESWHSITFARGDDSLGKLDHVRTIDWLTGLGRELPELIHRFDEALPVATAAGLTAVLARPLLFETWLTCFATGVVIGGDLGGVGGGLVTPADSPVVRAALSTLLPGAMRCLLPADMLIDLGRRSVDFAWRAIEDGSSLSGELLPALT